jgi:hypothetical protein
MSYCQQKQEKTAPPPHPKKQPGRSLLNFLINDGVFRPSKRYDSEAQGRHVSIDKNKELTGGETWKFNDNLLVLDCESMAIIALA